jgi:holo-[acyl-carrier protein] synthase
MPLRVGIDMVSVQEVRDSIAAHGQRYLERVYSAGEVADCSDHGEVNAERLAARFAAKEATFKVLRVGDEPISWREVEVRRERSAAPKLLLTGRVATLADRASIRDLALTLTHERGLAAAVVIAALRRTTGTEAE